MASIRTRLERGDIENSKPILCANFGKTPPGCCIRLRPPNMMKCDQIPDFVEFKIFKEKCAQCQAEMLYKIGGL